MMQRLILVVSLLLLLVSGPALAEEKAEEASGNPVVVMTTNMGVIEIELYPDKAPVSVKNFLTYVDDEFFDGTIFHRVIKNFMIQGGGFTAEMQKKATRDPIKNEADNGLKNKLGTVALARTPDINSATSQFFINTKDNVMLDHRSKDSRGFGYAVFGNVISGMDVVMKIEGGPTGARNRMRDVPLETVVIESIRRK